MSRIRIIREVSTEWPGEWNLCFQWTQYIYDSKEIPQYGYRFIWRRNDGSLQPARGQARLPSMQLIEELIQKAKDQGWGHYNDETFSERKSTG